MKLTVVTGVAQDAEIIQSGSIHSVVTVSTFKDAEKEKYSPCTDVAFGPASSVWTKDIGRPCGYELESGKLINDLRCSGTGTPHGGFLHLIRGTLAHGIREELRKRCHVGGNAYWINGLPPRGRSLRFAITSFWLCGAGRRKLICLRPT